MGVRIDTQGVMHDIGVDVTNVNETTAAQAANLLLDVNQTGPSGRSGYTTPPPPTQGVPRHRTMQVSYSDLSDDGEADTDLPEPVTKTTAPVLTAAMIQRSNNLLKRVHTDRPTDTVRFIIIIPTAHCIFCMTGLLSLLLFFFLLLLLLLHGYAMDVM